MRDTTLSQRQADIIDCLVREHIRTALPVSSEMLVRKYGFEMSSATMRNEFAALSEKGYLSQPYVSSGRVPTASAYQFFVAGRIDNWAPPHRFTEFLRETMTRSLLSDMASLLSATQEILHYFSETTHTVSILSFGGFNLQEGLEFVVSQPEFANTSGVQRLLDAVEDAERIFHTMPEVREPGRARVVIGNQDSLSDFDDFAMVFGFLPEGANREARGFAALGPMRMHYEKVVPMASELLQVLDRFVRV